MKYLILLSLLSANVWAKDCQYTASAKDFKVSWTAFKTPLKVGVGGKFEKLGIKKSSYKAQSLKELISGVEFNIDGTSVNTGNKDRDKKIVKWFFKPFGAELKGKLLKYEKKIIKMALTMNGVTKIVPLKTEKTKSSLNAVGVIDVLDFNLAKSLQGINKACLELHEGKTWSDVGLKLAVSFTKSCK